MVTSVEILAATKMQPPIPDKPPPNQQQPTLPQNMWGNNNGWPQYQMGYYGNQMPYGQPGVANNPYNMQYMQYNQNQQLTAQQIAFQNANAALMRNGVPTSYVGPPLPSMSMGNTGVTSNSDSNILPPLPPGPPPPINGQQQFTSTPTSTTAANVYQSSAPMYYGQASNTGPHIAFNMANKKTGLGYQPPLNNSGAGKKKRKKNKNRLMFNNTFQSAGTGHTFPLSTPPLPSETPPPFPPLPPEPSKKPPTPPHLMDTAEIFAASKAMSQNMTPNFSRQPSTLTSPASGKSTADALPDSLRAYVNRCYEKCIEDVDKDQVEIILKGKITRALQDGSMWTKNWDLELLPKLHSENTAEAKKAFPSNTTTARSPAASTASQRGSPLVGKRGRGLSAAMGSRLGGFGRGQRRPSPKTFTPAGKMVRARRSRTRSRTRSPSRSPARRRKDRSVSSSSSSSSDSYIGFTPSRGKKRGAGNSNSTGRPSLDSKDSSFMSKRAKKRLRREEVKAGKSHFYSEHGTIGQAEPVDSERLQTRAARFQNTLRNPSPSTATGRAPKRVLGLGVPTSFRSFDDEISDIDWKNFHIVGTCQDIDKEYLRQTTAPDPSTIRPVDVLRKALVAVQENWKLKSDYYFTCNRMKSIRLDLTLQNVRTEFTVKVYETHARIALEKGDHQELNQCLSQLTQLYVDVGGENRLEFTAYGILYYIFTKDTLELTTLLSRLTEADKADACIAHAVGVRTAWVTSNYHRFFKLYKEAPKMAGYAVELFVERERLSALKIMIKSYRPTLPVSHIKKELAFETHAKCIEFLAPLGLAYADPQRTKIECKLSTPIVVKL